jgi:hypothetical protein
MPNPLDLLEAWLVSHVVGAPANLALYSASTFPVLPQRTGSERMALLRELLDGHPALAQATRRLPAYDQFKLTLELLRGSDFAHPEATDARPANAQALHDQAWPRTWTCAAQCRGFSRRRRGRSG